MNEQRGEYTVILGPRATDARAVVMASDQEIWSEFGQQTEHAGSTRRGRVSAIARKHGRSAREIYAIIEKMKSSGI
jgi:hypothetical protein